MAPAAGEARPAAAVLSGDRPAGTSAPPRLGAAPAGTEECPPPRRRCPPLPRRPAPAHAPAPLLPRAPRCRAPCRGAEPRAGARALRRSPPLPARPPQPGGGGRGGPEPGATPGRSPRRGFAAVEVPASDSGRWRRGSPACRPALRMEVSKRGPGCGAPPGTTAGPSLRGGRAEGGPGGLASEGPPGRPAGSRLAATPPRRTEPPPGGPWGGGAGCRESVRLSGHGRGAHPDSAERAPGWHRGSARPPARSGPRAPCLRPLPRPVESLRSPRAPALRNL